MRKLCMTIFAILMASMLFAQEKESITFMPAWTPQAQFAGYYAAKEQGFYDELGLDVTIEHISQSSTKSNIESLQNGSVDIIVSNPIMVLNEGKKDGRIVNVMQVSQISAMALVCNKAIKDIRDLRGMKVGRWQNGYGEICAMFCKKNGVEVEWIPFLSGVNLFIAKAIDATACMTFNELLTLRESLGNFPDAYILKLSDHGHKIPEEGLYVREDYLCAHEKAVRDFCEATKRGWLWCLEHREEAVDIVMDYAAKSSKRTNRAHQKAMLDEMFRILTNPKSGKIDFQKIDRDAFDKFIQEMIENKYIDQTISYEEFCR